MRGFVLAVVGRTVLLEIGSCLVVRSHKDVCMVESVLEDNHS